MNMKRTAGIGFRVHSGWVSVVAVSVEKGVPTVLSRQRVHLVKTFSYKFRQPFHAAEKMPLGDAETFISGVRSEAENLAYRCARMLQSDLQKLGYQLRHGGLLLASGDPLPELPRILLSHALIHTADGELFREAIRNASSRCGLQLTLIRERTLMRQCEAAFSLTSEELLHQVKELGRPFGAPWSQDEKFATLASWLTHRDSRNSRHQAQGTISKLSAN